MSNGEGLRKKLGERCSCVYVMENTLNNDDDVCMYTHIISRTCFTVMGKSSPARHNSTHLGCLSSLPGVQHKFWDQLSLSSWDSFFHKLYPHYFDLHFFYITILICIHCRPIQAAFYMAHCIWFLMSNSSLNMFMRCHACTLMLHIQWCIGASFLSNLWKPPIFRGNISFSCSIVFHISGWADSLWRRGNSSQGSQQHLWAHLHCCCFAWLLVLMTDVLLGACHWMDTEFRFGNINLIPFWCETSCLHALTMMTDQGRLYYQQWSKFSRPCQACSYSCNHTFTILSSTTN